MNFLKRIEVWILLAILAGGLGWVFLSRPSPEDAAGELGTASSEAAVASGPLRLLRCVVERDYGNARLDVEVSIRNENDEKLRCLPPKVKLLTAQGREIPSFFLPFDKQPEVPGKTTQDVQLRYWAEESDLADALTLEVEGAQLPVKSTKPFDLQSMQNTEKKILKPGEW